MIAYITRYTDLRDKKFIIHPLPMNDELLSSWLVRVALAHQTMPWSFMNMHFPEYKNILFSRDIDVWAPSEFIEKLAWKSGLSENNILNLTLRSYNGFLCENIRSNGENIFISPIIARKRRNLGYGQKYCPVCLQENKPSYFKKEWRLSFYTVCLKHHCEMLDRCTKCGRPVTLYKYREEKGFLQCYFCGYFLGKQEREVMVPEKEVVTVKKLMKILGDGYVFIEGRMVYSIAFFQMFHQIINILIRFEVDSLNDNNHSGNSVYQRAESILANLQPGLKQLLSYPKVCPSHLSLDMEYIPYFYYLSLKNIGK